MERVSADGDGGFTCSGVARACPPEDCGGAHGYANLLEILNDPSHPEYRETKIWRRFDPERFDVAAVNRKPGSLSKRLRRLEEG